MAISGDLTYHGRPKEFELVEEFLKMTNESIAKHCKIVTPVSMIFCPGNHDKDRNDNDCLNAELMQDLFNTAMLGSVQRIEEKFKEEKQRIHLKAGMSNYYNFLEKIGQTFDKDFLYSAISLPVEKFKVNFVSMNSAYLYSKLFSYFGYVGKCQIEKAFAQAQANPPNDCKSFNIALFHHPFEAIPELSQQETANLTRSRFDIILNGHVHNMRVTVDVTACLRGENRQWPIISCSRCVIDSEIEDPYRIIDPNTIEDIQS